MTFLVTTDCSSGMGASLFQDPVQPCVRGEVTVVEHFDEWQPVAGGRLWLLQCEHPCSVDRVANRPEKGFRRARRDPTVHSYREAQEMTIEGYDKPVTYEPFQYLDYLPLGGDCRLGKGPDRRPFLACRVDGPIQILKLEIAGFRARPSVEHEEPITAGQDGERRLAQSADPAVHGLDQLLVGLAAGLVPVGPPSARSSTPACLAAPEEGRRRFRRLGMG